MVGPDFVLAVVVYFFIHLVLTQGMALIVGYGRLHFLGFSLPVLVGALTVSAVTSRLAYIAAEMGEMVLEPWSSAGAWVENSEVNAGLVSGYLASNPLLCFGLVALSLCLAFLFAGVITWASGMPALGLAPAYLAVLSYSMPEFFGYLGMMTVGLGGGGMGVTVPNVFAFIDAGKGLFFLTVSGVVALIVAAGLRWMRGKLDSHSGVRVDGSILFLGGGVMGLAGCLFSLYFTFVFQANFLQGFWGWWPLLMLVLAGFNRGWGLVGTVFGVHLLRALIVALRSGVGVFLFFPVAYLESLLLGLLLIAGLMIYQSRTVDSGVYPVTMQSKVQG